MANRRMFSKAVVSSGRFLRMPPTSRLLYYDLGMAADDDGVVEAYAVMTQTKATEDDLKVLVSKGYIKILNEDLVALIIHWKTNNEIKKDRYTPSIYKNLIQELTAIDQEPAKIEASQEWNQNGTKMEPLWNQNGTGMEPQVSIGKVSIDKVSLVKDREKEKKEKEAHKGPRVFFPNDELLNNTFNEFVKMRKQIKKPMTDHAIDLAIKRLENLSNGDQEKAVQILNRSIEGSWSGLYPLEETRQIKPTGGGAVRNWEAL